MDLLHKLFKYYKSLVIIGSISEDYVVGYGETAIIYVI